MLERALVLFSVIEGIAAHGKMLCPLPRQYRNTAPVSWTHWQGIVVPGDGSFSPGEGNAANLNSNIGGGVANEKGAQAGSHGLCGDLGGRNGFNSPDYYGAEPARGTFIAGETMSVQVQITAWHSGWLEFRLGKPASPDGVITQEELNMHVLEIDESTPDYPAIVNYAGMNGYGGGGGGAFKCKYTGGDPWPTLDHPNQGFVDATATSPQTLWPHGTCCNDGGACSDPAANKDRYILEFSSSASASVVSYYTVVLKVPSNLTCDDCVLQWAYVTANSRDTYSEVFWNCADVAIKPAGYSGATGCDVPGAGTPSEFSPPPPKTTPLASPPPGADAPPGGGSSTCGACACSDCKPTAAYADPSWGYEPYCATPERKCPSGICECTGSEASPPPSGESSYPPPLTPPLVPSLPPPEAVASSPPPPGAVMTSPPPPLPLTSPPPPTSTCGPTLQFPQCTEALKDLSAFLSACLEWCGACQGVRAIACPSDALTTYYVPSSFCAAATSHVAGEPAMSSQYVNTAELGSDYPAGSTVNTCQCHCHAVAGCVDQSETCAFAPGAPLTVDAAGQPLTVGTTKACSKCRPADAYKDHPSFVGYCATSYSSCPEGYCECHDVATKHARVDMKEESKGRATALVEAAELADDA